MRFLFAFLIPFYSSLLYAAERPVIEGYDDVKMGLGEEGYILGQAYFFPVDSDIYSLGFVSEEDFSDIALYSPDEYLDYENRVVTVEAGGVYTLNMRSAGKYDIYSPVSFDHIKSFDGLEVKYACFGRRYSEMTSGILQCSIFHNSQNIMTDLIKKGIAKYLGNIDIDFIHDELDRAQNIAIQSQAGLWSPYYSKSPSADN